jgi:hypothetical protein
MVSFLGSLFCCRLPDKFQPMNNEHDAIQRKSYGNNGYKWIYGNIQNCCYRISTDSLCYVDNGLPRSNANNYEGNETSNNAQNRIGFFRKVHYNQVDVYMPFLHTTISNPKSDAYCHEQFYNNLRPNTSKAVTNIIAASATMPTALATPVTGLNF